MSAVGQVFIVAMATTVLIGPLLGVIIDRYNRKHIVIVSHLSIGTTLLALGFAIQKFEALPLYWFFISVAIVTVFRNLYEGSHDGMLRANAGKQKLVHVVARFRGVHLLAAAIGTVLTGISIEVYSPTFGFSIAFLSSLFLVLTVVFVKGVVIKENAKGFSGFILDFKSGLALFRDNQSLKILTILASVSLPIGQLSNAILSSFIRNDLGRGSDAFGYVDAAWPIGGMAAALLLSLGIGAISKPNMEYLFSFFIGIATITFAFCESLTSLAVIHGTMGLFVWMCRITIDGRVLQICTEETVGRTRTYVNVMFSFSAVIMCFSPTIIKLSSAGGYFFIWGVIVVICSLLLFLTQKIRT